ncbi:MAG: hypothetical protein QHI38_05215 [Armatimonadota bacterium]|nr:hypothetical protein [Armatimonadota bacterium]
MKMNVNGRVKLFLCIAVGVAAAVAMGQQVQSAVHADKFSYPYGSKQFTQLVDDSYRENRLGDAKQFYAWFEKVFRQWRYGGKPGPGLNSVAAQQKHRLEQVASTSAKASGEAQFAAWLHGMVKKTIPHFNLDTGFEFCNAALRGDRQCLLQSVLIAAILQEAGIDAGIAMVCRNSEGQDSNNGHVVTLVKLSDGEDLLVDASHPEPYVPHQRLLMRTTTYVYVQPVYSKGRNTIVSYIAVGSHKKLPTAKVRPLDYNFVRSQFYFYRGERAKGGLLYRDRTAAGLAAEERELKKSVRLCPGNPLAVYMLGRLHLMQGKTKLAATELTRAYDLYRSYGWVPQGVKDCYSLLRDRLAAHLRDKQPQHSRLHQKRPQLRHSLNWPSQTHI